MQSRWFGLAVVGLGVVALPVAAFAGHGKAGLWEINTQMSMPNMASMMSPDQMARMQAMGVHMPTTNSATTQYCRTAAQVAQDSPPPTRAGRECTMGNTKILGQTYSADMTCTGRMQGTGHYSVTFDSDEHFSGSTSFTGTANGHPANMSNSFEGKWLSADCGTVK
jgi:hypothetical protein